MGTLIRYEFKKLLGRKALWVALALVLALVCYDMKTVVAYKLDGYIQGMRDGIAPFEGQALTDAVATQARALLLRYAQEHPDEFEYADNGEDIENPVPFAKGRTDYASGLWQGCMKIAQGSTLQQRQKNLRLNQERLDSGYYEDGRKLTERDRTSIMENMEYDRQVPVIRYAAGWEQLHFAMQGPGIFLFFLLVVGLTALFIAERVARMDNILLSAKTRRQAIGAKVIVSAVYALALFSLFFGLEIASVALSFGLEGGQYTIRELSGHYWNLTYGTMYSAVPVGSPYAPALALTALSAVACAWLIALASSLFQHPLAALGAAVAVLAVQFLPPMLTHFGEPPSASLSLYMIAPEVQAWAASMPAYQLRNMSKITTLIVNGAPLWQCVALPALLAAAAAVATPAVFCRHRKV